MLKARGTMSGREALTFGLSYGNLDRLRAGDPIEFDGRDIGIDAIVRIFSMRDEATMADMLRRSNPGIVERLDNAGDGHTPNTETT